MCNCQHRQAKLCFRVTRVYRQLTVSYSGIRQEVEIGPLVYDAALISFNRRVNRPNTFPPACERTAKQKRVEGLVFPSTLKSPKAAACPSMGWDTFLSTEYSCMAPTTRFCCGTQGVENRFANTVSVPVPLCSTEDPIYSFVFVRSACSHTCAEIPISSSHFCC